MYKVCAGRSIRGQHPREITQHRAKNPLYNEKIYKKYINMNMNHRETKTKNTRERNLTTQKIEKPRLDENCRKAKTFGCAWPCKKLHRGDHAEVTPISAQFLGESLWPAVVLKVWDTPNIHSSVACDHTGFSK